MRLSQTQLVRVPIDNLAAAPYISVLTYPNISLSSAKSRIRQLGELGVSEIIFEGKTKIGKLCILGLGTVSLVVKAISSGQLFALKIRRTDSNRKSMYQEFKLTTLANRIGVGAKAVGCTKDLMLMQLLDYVELHDWFKNLKGKEGRSKAKFVVHKILNQCRKLDIIGLDHGQLSNLRKHAVIANDYPWIIDFESSSLNRDPRNVTTAAQYLLIGSKISPLVRMLLGINETSTIINALREYKREKSDISYAKLLELLRLSD